MKTLNILVYISVSLLFYSCFAQNESELIFEKEVKIPYGRSINTFVVNDSLYFFTCEMVSRKEIEIYNYDGSLSKTLKIKFLPGFETLDFVRIINYDSIFVYLGDPLQYVYMIDSASNIKAKKVIPKAVINDSVILCMRKLFGKDFYNNAIYTQTHLFPKEWTTTTNYIMSNKVARGLPLYYKLPLQDSSVQYEGYGQGGRKYMYNNNDSLIMPWGIYDIANKYMFCLHDYTAVVYDLDNNQLWKTIKLKSNNMDLPPYKQVPITNSAQALDLEIKYSEINKNNPHPKFVIWNPQTEQYYFFLISPKKAYFLVLVYDKDLNFVKDFKMKDENEISEVALFDNKLILLYYNKKNIYDNVTFKIYNINF